MGKVEKYSHIAIYQICGLWFQLGLETIFVQRVIGKGQQALRL